MAKKKELLEQGNTDTTVDETTPQLASDEDGETGTDTNDMPLTPEPNPEAPTLPEDEEPGLPDDNAALAAATSEPETDLNSSDTADSEAPAKPQPKSRRKKADTTTEDIDTTTGTDPSTTEADTLELNTPITEVGSEAIIPLGTEPDEPDALPIPVAPSRTAQAPVLTIEARSEVETEADREDAIWHEIHNAYRTRRILSGQLGGIEQTDNGKTIAIVDYKSFRIVIPLKEMMINLERNPSGQAYTELMLRQNKILGNMLGTEIDFIIKGIDSKSRSVVASRREAMLKKRQIFYMETDDTGIYRIYDGRVVQARVIAVAEKVIRVEVFGVECSIMARDISWDWLSDAHERYSVGDTVLVRVLSVQRESLEEISIKADIKSVSQNTNHDNLKKCRIQSKYAGKVTDVRKGVVYIRLNNGVNAVAHSCYDYRTPGKKDDVSFAVTKLDEERGLAVGIITRIIRQNL